jgi:hypothetical protein
VINLSTDEPLGVRLDGPRPRPGGRIGVGGRRLDDELTPDQREQRGSYMGCIAGAPSFSEYREGLAEAGFEDISITPTHGLTDGMHAAIIRAVRTASQRGPGAPREPPLVPGGRCC